MISIVNIRLHGRGKPQRFDSRNLPLSVGDAVVVETEQGTEFGVVATTPIAYEERVEDQLPMVNRIATEDDFRHYEANQRLEADAFRICKERIRHFSLNMELIDAQYLFDNRKLIFYFMADGRVDFRQLVKDLASIFHVRIELKQIGVRDEARLVGGIGQCGRELCCGSFLKSFHPVTIKMVKEQKLSMNPQKISGVCGRLLCCLNYEQKVYEDLNSRLPTRKSIVMTPQGKGVVIGCQALKELVHVRLDGEEAETVLVQLEDIEVLMHAKAKRSGKR